MPKHTTHKNLVSRLTNEERADAVVAEFSAVFFGMLGKDKVKLKGIVFRQLKAACKQALARDDVRDGKPQRRAFLAAGGKIPQ